MQDIAVEFVDQRRERVVSRHAGRVLLATRSANAPRRELHRRDRRTGPRRHARAGRDAAARPPAASSSSAAPTTATSSTSAAARAQFQSFEPRLDDHLPVRSSDKGARGAAGDLARRFHRLLPDRLRRTARAKTSTPLTYLDRVAAVASAPTYSWVDSAMDHGIVGGSLHRPAGQMEAVASWRSGCFTESRPTASRCPRPI